MHKVILFVEDRGHAEFIQALVERFANQYGISVIIRLGSATGGHGKVLSRLKEYINDLLSDQEELPDLLIVATDGNCKGYSGRKQEIDNAVKGFNRQIIYAIPDPHIERWLLLDSAAFKKVLGKDVQLLSRSVSVTSINVFCWRLCERQVLTHHSVVLSTLKILSML